jgi:hypothetical protein
MGREPFAACRNVQQFHELLNPKQEDLAAPALYRIMTNRSFIFAALLLLALSEAAAGQAVVPESTPPIGPAKSDLFRRVIANQKKSESELDLYERVERVETRKSDSDSAPVTIKTTRVIPSGTGMFKVPLRVDGSPEDSATYRKDLEALANALTQLVSNSASQREALEKYAKKKRERLELIGATHDAFLFTRLGSEKVGDRTLMKFQMDPNPSFRPTTRFTSIFPKVHGFAWVDESAGQLARVECDVTEDISVGLFLGKIYKGSHFMQERYEFLPGVWQASFSQYDFDGRKLFSAFSVHERTFYSNYRYIGPPKEALATIREELGHAGLDKAVADPAHQ